jgi:hypothetical protein
LDQVEYGIAALASDEVARDASVPAEDPACEFRPQLCRGPEIELVFHHAHNPFAERFEEEEVIVDPFASLETLSGARPAPVVQHSEDRSPARGPSAASGDASAAMPNAGDAEFDPVLPDDADEVVATPLSCADASDSAPPGDDRDLLQIVDDSPELPEDYALAIAAYRPRRREYRQLFASLRGH